MRGRSGKQNALRSGMVVLGSLAFAYLSFKVGFNPYLEQARKAMEGSEPTAGVPFETEQFMPKPHTSPISFPQEKDEGPYNTGIEKD